MNARELLIRHEGLRLEPYRDTVGKLTVGVGRNLDDIGISHDEAMLMLDNDIHRAYTSLEVYSWFAGLSEARKAAMLNLCFNLGPTRLAGFVKFLKAMAVSDWVAAANELQSSKWRRQVGRRADEIMDLIKDEKWPD
jgi:lysozyme